MKDNPLIGARYLLQGFRLVLRPGLRRFVLVPFVVNLLIFSLFGWFGASQFQVLMDWLLAQSSWFEYLTWLLWPLFALAMALVMFYSFTVVANLIAAPFNGLLSERVQQLLGGAAPTAGSGGDLLKDLLPSILSELRKLGYFLLRAAPLLLLFLIPVVNLAAPFLWLAFSAWFLALEYADYPMANNGLGFAQQHERLRGMRLTALGFGGSVTLLMMIPVLNFLAMPAAVAGATVLWHERFGQNRPVPTPSS